MTVSMTGFAAGHGAGLGFDWSIELRSVNGKGLDLRLRVPDWIEGLEAAVRAQLQGRMARGNVSLTIRLARDETALGAEAFAVNEPALAAALAALARVEAAAMAAGVTLGQGTAADVLGLRGILGPGGGEEGADPARLRAAILADLAPVVEAFVAMRRAEGAELSRTLAGQLDRIAALCAEAAAETEARRVQSGAFLREAMSRALAALDQPLDEARLAQEVAMIAVKADIQEEIDRLRAHVAAARGLLATGEAVGRKLDFLTQEFLREANTLCSKSQNLALTRIGLDLKTVIDQMREQVQNVE